MEEIIAATPQNNSVRTLLLFGFFIVLGVGYHYLVRLVPFPLVLILFIVSILLFAGQSLVTRLVSTTMALAVAIGLNMIYPSVEFVPSFLYMLPVIILALFSAICPSLYKLKPSANRHFKLLYVFLGALGCGALAGAAMGGLALASALSVTLILAACIAMRLITGKAAGFITGLGILAGYIGTAAFIHWDALYLIQYSWLEFILIYMHDLTMLLLAVLLAAGLDWFYSSIPIPEGGKEI